MSSFLEEDAGAEARHQALRGGDRAAKVAGLYDSSWRVRRFAAELLAKEPVDEALLDALFAVLADRPATSARNAAATALSMLGAPARPRLLALLQHPDAEQRKFGADILKERGESEALPVLERALFDADPNVVAAAAEALGQIGGASATRSVMALLESPHALVRACALEALFELKRPPSLVSLKRLLPARQAFRLIGLIDHPAAYGVLCRSLSAPSTREAALEALGLGDRTWPHDADEMIARTVAALPEATLWLAKMLEHEIQAVRVGAMRAAAAIRAHHLAVPIARAVGDGAAAHAGGAALVRLGLRGAFELLGREGEVPPIATLESEARAVAADALMRVGEPALVPPLTRLLDYADNELAEVAVRALGRCRSPLAVAPLLRALADDALASAAARALGRIGASFPDEVFEALSALPMRPHLLRARVWVDPKGAAEAVRSAARDADPAMRAVACELVSRLPAADIAEALGRGLSDEAASVRRAAARALPAAPRSSVLPLLQRALSDVEPSVVSAACDSAAVTRLPEVTHRLAQLLEAPHGFVVLAAFQALVAMDALGSREEGLALGHSDPEVLKAALTLLADRPGCAPFAHRHVAHPRWDVRTAAARALAMEGSPAAHAAIREAHLVERDALARSLLRDLVTGP